jgi:hypothetical protein
MELAGRALVAATLFLRAERQADGHRNYRLEMKDPQA